MAPLIPEGIFSIPFYLNHTSSSPQDDEILKMWKKLSYCIGEIQIRRIGVIIVGPRGNESDDYQLSSIFPFPSLSILHFPSLDFHTVSSI